MKINDFFITKPRILKSPTQFVLSNEHKEQQLEIQVKELKDELSHLKEVETTNHDLKWRESNYSAEKRETQQTNETLLRKIDVLDNENKRLLAFEQENQSFHIQIKHLTSDIDNLKSVTELAQSNSMSKDKEFLNLQNKFDSLFKEELSIRSELNHAQSKVKTKEVKFAEISKIYNETKDSLKITQGNLQDVTQQANYYKDEEIFWKNRATNLEQEVSQLKNIENNLLKWSSNLKEDSVKTTGINKMKTKKLSKAQNTIAQMGNTINDLVKDLTYVRKINSKLEYEVSRPRYASMGAIAKNEGFVMPMGKENIRTKFLGNSSPKLLKFKEKRNDN